MGQGRALADLAGSRCDYRYLHIGAGMTTMDSPENTPAAVIRAQIAVRCRALGLSSEHQLWAENEGLDCWWRHARSIAYCVAAGVRRAQELAK
jgi:hypothetical protein